MDRTLVTGATGFVGAEIVRQLRAAGTPVRLALRTATGDAEEVVVGDIGPDAKAALPEVADLFEAPSNGLTEVAGRALAALGKVAVKALVKGLKHDVSGVRSASVAALAAIGKDAASALPALKTVAKSDRDMSIQMAAERAIEKIKGAK